MHLSYVMQVLRLSCSTTGALTSSKCVTHWKMTSWMHKPFCVGALCGGKSLCFWWDVKAMITTLRTHSPLTSDTSREADQAHRHVPTKLWISVCVCVCVCVFVCPLSCVLVFLHALWVCGHTCVCMCVYSHQAVPACNRCSWLTNPPLS